MTATPCRNQTRRSQSGASLLAVLYIIFTLAVILMVGIKAVPVYLNDHDISKAVNEVAADPSLTDAPPIEIRRAFTRRLDAGYAEDVSASNLEISNNGSQRVLSVTYDVHRKLFFNIDLLFHFHDTATLGSGKSA